MSSPAAGAARASSPWWSRIRDRWWALSLRQRVHLVLLLVATGAAVGHQVSLWTWYIEDAAISFAYARNLASGEGLVPYVGGERIEGYSNPTWVFLLAFFELFGAPSEASARWIQAALTALTVPVVYLLAREAAPRERSEVPILAAALLAGSTQFAIWGSSGLENGLMNLLLAVALWRGAVEARTGGFPFSAFWFFLVAISRPEAILYAAVGGFVALVANLHARRGLVPVLKWLLTFFGPFFAYHAWRYDYFAWLWPNTYYAKVGDHRHPKPLEWERAGWRYVRNWAWDVGMGVFTPLVFLGLTGARGRRALAALAATLVVALTVLLPGDQRLLLPVVLGFTYLAFYAAVSWQTGRPRPLFAWLGLLLVGGFIGAAELMRAQGAESQLPSPDWLVGSPPYALLAAFVLLPLASVGPRGWQARLACWGTAGVAVFFACWSLGDWMKGFRWLSFATVPGSVLLACGVAGVADLAQDALGRRPGSWRLVGWGAAAGLVAAIVWPNVDYTIGFEKRRETSPYAVKHRVDYMKWVRNRLHIEGRVVDLDIDQGAHLWWSDFWMLDLAGLVDVPLAQHRFQKPFVREYVFDEHKPHFAHVHGGWATSSRIPTLPEWRRDYVEIPGYPTSRTQVHPGNHVRRDLIVTEAWPYADDRRVSFADGVELVGWNVPSPEAARGRRFFVEVGFRSPARRKEAEDFRVVLFLTGAEPLASWELPMGYDWLPPHEWTPAEIFHGKFSLQLPDEIPEGTYGLGFAVLGGDGRVLAAEGELPEGTVRGEADAVYAVGEVRFTDPALTVVSVDALLAHAESDRDAALAHAEAGRCEEAEHAWWLARMHHPRAHHWASDNRPAVARALADCWVAQAAAEPDREVEHLERAREWDHRAPSLKAAAAPVADRLHAEGLAARAAEDWERAYRAFSDVLRVDTSRSWSRRWAEEARAHRLGIDPETKAAQEAERKRRAEEARQRAEERAKARAAEADARKAAGRVSPKAQRPPGTPDDG